MPAIDIPDPLPPAITPPRTVIEFLIDQDLDEYGDRPWDAAPARARGTTTVDEPGPRATVRSGRLWGDTCSRTCLGVPR